MSFINLLILNKNTNQIQTLIDKVSEDGGGTIVVPEGEFYTGALFFKPGTHLKLKEGATLKGSDDISNYPLIPSRMEGQSIYYYAALINAYNTDSFSIEGPGTIDGNGLKYWESFWKRRKELINVNAWKQFFDMKGAKNAPFCIVNNITLNNINLPTNPLGVIQSNKDDKISGITFNNLLFSTS